MTRTSPENDDSATPRRPVTPEAGSSAAGPARSRPAEPERGASAPGGVSAGRGTPKSDGRQGTATTGRDGVRRTGKDGRDDRGGDWSVFRAVVILVGLVLAAFGTYYLITGSAGLPDTEVGTVNPTLENQFRFFSAMMIGVGAAFITIAVKFQWANMLWLVCLMVFIGGIGRVLSWAFSGTPNYLMIILMVVELAFPPALLVWHRYIAKTSDLRREYAGRD